MATRHQHNLANAKRAEFARLAEIHHDADPAMDLVESRCGFVYSQ